MFSHRLEAKSRFCRGDHKINPVSYHQFLLSTIKVLKAPLKYSSYFSERLYLRAQTFYREFLGRRVEGTTTQLFNFSPRPIKFLSERFLSYSFLSCF